MAASSVPSPFLSQLILKFAFGCCLRVGVPILLNDNSIKTRTDISRSSISSKCFSRSPVHCHLPILLVVNFTINENVKGGELVHVNVAANG